MTRPQGAPHHAGADALASLSHRAGSARRDYASFTQSTVIGRRLEYRGSFVETPVYVQF